MDSGDQPTAAEIMLSSRHEVNEQELISQQISVSPLLNSKHINTSEGASLFVMGS